MMARRDHSSRDDYVDVGRVLGAWGVRGDVKVFSLTDFPERFSAGSVLYLAGAAVVVERSRPQRDTFVVKLRGVESRDDAESLQGAYLQVPETALHPLPPGEYYRHQLLGMTVWSTEGEKIGCVKEVLSTGSNDVFLVEGDRQEYAIPNIQDIVQEVDLPGGRIIVHVVPGLLD